MLILEYCNTPRPMWESQRCWKWCLWTLGGAIASWLGGMTSCVFSLVWPWNPGKALDGADRKSWRISSSCRCGNWDSEFTSVPWQPSLRSFPGLECSVNISVFANFSGPKASVSFVIGEQQSLIKGHTLQAANWQGQESCSFLYYRLMMEKLGHKD